MLTKQYVGTSEGIRTSIPAPSLIARRLSQYAKLSIDETELLDGICSHSQSFRAGEHMLADRETLNRPRIMLSGWACRFRTLADGRRQIFEFILPGDIYGLSHRPHAVAPGVIMALTPCTIADARVLGEAVIQMPQIYPGLATACAVVRSLDEAWLYNQLMRVGRQTAYERVAHLFLEISHRLNAVNLADGGTISMPLTQETIADAMGLSVVHLNRTLQQLRREGLIEFKNGTLRILKQEQLGAIADFRVPNVQAMMPA